VSVFEPTFEDGCVVLIEIVELQSSPKIGFREDHGGGRLKHNVAGGNFNQDFGADGEGINHIEIATVQAELADAAGDAYFRISFNQFRGGDKGISRCTAALLIHANSLP